MSVSTEPQKMVSGKEIAMREQWRKHGKMVRMGLLIIVLSIAGLIEYIQLAQSFDLPQVMLVIPVVGALSMIFLGKFSFFVPGCVIVLSCIYQILAGSENAIAELQTNARSVVTVWLGCLAVLLLFELLGMAGGALIRILTKRKKSLYIGVPGCILGILLVFGPYLALFRNPLYPLLARHRLTSYAEEHITDYPILEKKVYYSMSASAYQCRVTMSDGRIRMIYIEAGYPIIEVDEKE